MREGIDKASKEAAKILLSKAHKVETNNDIASVASISAGSTEIGGFIAEAMEKVGKDGVITVDESKGFDLSLIHILLFLILIKPMEKLLLRM